jgi:hypothetical protein
MMQVQLSEQEWNWLINVLAEKLSWKDANPILMKIGAQLKPQQTNQQASRMEAIDGKSIGPH